MTYVKSDIKNLYKNKMIQAMLIGFLLVMIASPISMYFINTQWDEFIEVIGGHPFQFWLLMDTVSWGNSVYYALFWCFPVIATGLLYYHERSSSVYELLLIRNNRKAYFISKAISQFVITFLNFFIGLLINILVTYLIYSSNAPMTEQYMYLIPKEGMFASYFYNINPLCMIFIYTFLNALTIALLSLFVLALHEIFVFKNTYVAFLVPFIALYIISYLISLFFADKPNYDFSIMIQPRAASALVTTIKGSDVFLVFFLLVMADIVLLLIGYLRNREVC